MSLALRHDGLFRRLFRARRGTASVEFAFVFPLLLVAVVATIEIMGILFATALMEGGLREASRFGITGLEPDGVSREQRIVALVNRAGIGLVTVGPGDIATSVYGSFSDIGQPEPWVDADGNGAYDLGEPFTDVNGNGQWDADMGAAGIGGPGDVVVYSLRYDWPLFTPVLVPFIGHDGMVTLQASVAVRNEPYDTPPPPLPGT